MKELKRVAEDIRSITIQGATNVALEGVAGFAAYVQRLNNMQNTEFFSAVDDGRSLLGSSRSTEPALQNGLRYLLRDVEQCVQENGIGAAKNRIAELATDYIQRLTSSKDAIARIGAARIEDGARVMTHCHSSFAVEVILEAAREGKTIRAFCTETRPRYQGHKTARKLVSAGIDTTMIVDSAMRWLMRRQSVDMIITGADAITSQGTVINKIGTRLLALAAREMDISFYSAASLLKFDVETSLGALTEIEMRSPDEIWQDRPPGLKMFNPAFETISRDLIDGLITEKGIFPPSAVYGIVADDFPFLLHTF